VDHHEERMRAALTLAARHRPSPNPRVGAVVVAGDEVVGQGAHMRAGEPHAEVHALAAAGTAARGSTLYVTLEPCVHVGRTGPCVEAIIAAGIARVVFAGNDPNPVASGGADRLREAGVEVIGGVLAHEAAALNRGWLHAVEHGRPHVTWKVASTLDGRTAADDGSSKWITGEAARADVQRLRSNVDAVVTGTGTALADNARLDVRIPTDRQPLRVVVGDRSIPADFHLAHPDVLRLPHGDPALVLKHLHERGARSVLLECGATLAGAFMRAGLVDEVVAYLAPALLGSGRPMIDDLGIDAMAGIRRLELIDVAALDSDVRITAKVVR
jgi:diaminohydroxyphosphoribosylaminopyrimidine deaminase/5-amino-6-(5-phosphoribosylamino)uracil reductase